MRITPVLLSLVVSAGISATAATLSSPPAASLAGPNSAVQEKTADETPKDTKKEEKAEKITVWILDAAGKG